MPRKTNPPSSTTLVALALAAVVCWRVAALAEEVPSGWLTRAETSGYRATTSADETLALLHEIDARSEHIRLESFGRSAAGRDLVVAIVSTDGAFDPAAARATGKPVLLIQSCIHPGEMDGKEASLMILRDLALGRRRAWPEVIVLWVPILNPDGHERVFAGNRVNQEGPEENVGFRGTANRLDLNRDHMKLDSVEARALVDLVTRWRPHLHVDNHVTDGADHQWVLTWSRAWAPQLAPSLDEWMEKHLPPVLAATESAGHLCGPYVGLRNDLDPTQGIDSSVAGPRLSTGYFALRNIPSLLVEMHAYKSFEQRVRANHDFLVALLEEVARHSGSLVEAGNAARERTVALGRSEADPSRAVLQWQPEEATTETIVFPAFDWFTEESVVSGELRIHFRRGEARTIEVPWYHRQRPELDVARPRGYLVVRGWPQLEEKLLAHGLRLLRLTRSEELDVETIRIAEPRFEDSSYQGRVRLEVEVSRQSERRSVPAGAIWIPADQPDFEVAVQLLEPEAPDSLVRWGFLSAVLEAREYVSRSMLEGLARKLLADPEIRSAWEEALLDQDFEADSLRRDYWWYRRTPYWDDEVGLLPILRVMGRPSFAAEEWPGR